MRYIRRKARVGGDGDDDHDSDYYDNDQDEDDDEEEEDDEVHDLGNQDDDMYGSGYEASHHNSLPPRGTPVPTLY